MTTTAESTGCFSCDSDLPVDAQFCPGCGVAVDNSVMVLDPLDSGESGVIHTSDDNHRAGSRSPGEPSGEPDRRVLAVVGLFAVGLIAWLLLRTPVTTLDGLADALAPESQESESELGGGEDQPDAEAVGSARLTVDFAPAELGGGSPPLGEELGLDLYASHGSALARINLDTGDTEVFRVEGQPAAIRGDELLLLSNQQILMVDLADPEGPSRLVYDLPVNSSADLPELFVVDEDRLVMTFQSFGRDRVRQTNTVLNLVSGQAETIDLPSSAFSRFGLVWVPGGGTFDYVDGEFVKVFDGSVFSAGPTSGIGFRCEQPGDCGAQLFDRRTGEVLNDAVLPSFDQPWALQQLAGSDRYLMVYEFVDFSEDGPSDLRVFDMESGEYLIDGLFPSPGVAADVYIDDPQQVAVWGERYLAVGVSEAIRVQDIEANLGWELQLDGIVDGSFGQPDRLFFVPRDG